MPILGVRSPSSQPPTPCSNSAPVIMLIEIQPVPGVPLVIDDLGYTDDGITHVSARLG